MFAIEANLIKCLSFEKCLIEKLPHFSYSGIIKVGDCLVPVKFDNINTYNLNQVDF